MALVTLVPGVRVIWPGCPDHTELLLLKELSSGLAWLSTESWILSGLAWLSSEGKVPSVCNDWLSLEHIVVNDDYGWWVLPCGYNWLEAMTVCLLSRALLSCYDWVFVSRWCSGVHDWLSTRLLHPQHFDGIWTGQTPYRLTYETLSKYPKPCSWIVFTNSALWAKLV